MGNLVLEATGPSREEAKSESDELAVAITDLVMLAIQDDEPFTITFSGTGIPSRTNGQKRSVSVKNCRLKTYILITVHQSISLKFYRPLFENLHP